jgi:hypothetical protein
MTYFTDSVYEKMMVQKPKKGWEKKLLPLMRKSVKKGINRIKSLSPTPKKGA